MRFTSERFNWCSCLQKSLVYLISADVFPAQIEGKADTIFLTNITERPNDPGAVGEEESLNVEDLDREQDGLC